MFHDCNKIPDTNNFKRGKIYFVRDVSSSWWERPGGAEHLCGKKIQGGALDTLQSSRTVP
jgi:hypothetical protein